MGTGLWEPDCDPDQDPDVLPVELDSEREGGDERTELLLAATFLLMVILR